jgi:hypothetical protein
MGYWGYFVVGRGERPLTELEALASAGPDMTLRAEAPGGWQVWEYPSSDGDVGNLNALARESGAPALFEHRGAARRTHCGPRPLAENLFFRLLDRLGVVPL